MLQLNGRVSVGSEKLTKVLLAGAVTVASLCAVEPALAKAGFGTVYSFGAQPDATLPISGLVDVQGTMWGTSLRGGADGNGAVYTINPRTGAEDVVYSFANGTDGQYSYANLIRAHGLLYGVTEVGGAYGYGTVFSINPATGAETVVYSFGSSSSADGEYPSSSLIFVKGTLYGTTPLGGTHNYGTAFSLDLKTGVEAVLYSFCSQSACADGSSPEGNLIDVNGTLYGTVINGGVNYGAGLVFAINTATGAESTAYEFCSQANCTDGEVPYSGLTNVNGTLYGTSSAGGASGNGTVFSFDPGTGAETVVYSFAGGADAASPYTNLLNLNGMLYGVTSSGGADGFGTLYSVNPGTGAETVLHSFTDGTDGGYPGANLIYKNGALWGTSELGGASGEGTVFKYKNP